MIDDRGQRAEGRGQLLAPSPATGFATGCRGQLLAPSPATGFATIWYSLLVSCRLLAPSPATGFPTGWHWLLVSQCWRTRGDCEKHWLTSSQWHPSKRGRRGITLLEVLVSIGVIAVGLLGVATLIPLGSFAVNETAKADRSAALGRAAMHEVRVRDMLERMRTSNYARWHFARNGLAFDNSALGNTARNLFLLGQPFAIDPMFATEAAVQQSAVGFDVFPYAPANPPCITLPQLQVLMLNNARLTRLRLDSFEGALRMDRPTDSPPFVYYTASDPLRAALSEQHKPVLDRIFFWQDDLLFDLDADDPDRRPRQSYVWDDANREVTPFPIRSDDNLPSTISASVNKPLHAQGENLYSWMLTVEPDPTELPNTLPQLTAHKQKVYTVSIVTFYRRDFSCDANPPCERFVEMNFLGTRIGGGDAMLGVPVASMSTQEEAEEFLKIKENQWTLVTGFVREPRLDVIYNAYTGLESGIRRIAKWYRVIRLDDEVQLIPANTAPYNFSEPYYIRNITMAGPDWDPNWPNSLTLGPTGSTWTLTNTPHATIIDGAIGVYTTTVTLD
ncbi:MAG: prepilin-type N-terminal cleavage/methylation domain-containing protein [Pirellulales bacterium]|nr:prepilin-type N-terminal cleavage/methylation domain-containing protein [Pirellulales bacterium]